MRSIAKIGAVLIAVSMLSLILFESVGCGDPIADRPNVSNSKANCTIKVKGSPVQSGTDILFETKTIRSKPLLDSLLTLDGVPVYFSPIPTLDIPLGAHTLKVQYFYADSTTCNASWSVDVISDVIPEIWSYTVLDMFDHDPEAYTQGLVYHDGLIYEGTGNYGESKLYRYAPGQAVMEPIVPLPINIFGEGVTILGERLYQLTWKAKTGYVYDLNSLEQIGSFPLPCAEGWGLTDNGTDLIISDGSNLLYYLDPITYSLRRTQTIYHNKGKQERLNELEYVKGDIYANIYGEDIIAKIDANSGKVMAYIDCRNIMPTEYYSINQDVFNGIAYNKDRGTFYVTGKYWSKIFEVLFNPPATKNPT